MTSEARRPSHADEPNFQLSQLSHGNEANVTSRETSPRLEEWQNEMMMDLLGLDAWLRNRKKFIVDMFLADDLPQAEPLSPEKALPKIRTHLERIAEEGLGNLPREFKKHNAKLRSVETFLEEKDRVEHGEPKGNWFEIFPLVMDFEPILIPEEGLEETRSDLYECLEKVGRRPETDDDEGIKQAMIDYHEDTKLATKTQIERTYLRHARRARSQLVQTLNRPDLMDVDYVIKWKEEDEFYKMYEKLDRRQWHLDANWHSRHREEYDEGLVQQYGVHEDHHFVQGQAIKTRIASEGLHPLSGCIPQPGPDNYQMEGLALTVSLFAHYSLSPDAKLGLTYYRLQKRAIAHGMYRVESGEDIDTVSGFLTRYMPLKTQEEIKKLLEEATSKPFDRFYQGVYGMAEYELSNAVQNLSPEKRLLFFKNIYPQLMNREEIHDALTAAIVA